MNAFYPENSSLFLNFYLIISVSISKSIIKSTKFANFSFKKYSNLTFLFWNGVSVPKLLGLFLRMWAIYWLHGKIHLTNSLKDSMSLPDKLYLLKNKKTLSIEHRTILTPSLIIESLKAQSVSDSCSVSKNANPSYKLNSGQSSIKIVFASSTFLDI